MSKTIEDLIKEDRAEIKSCLEKLQNEVDKPQDESVEFVLFNRLLRLIEAHNKAEELIYYDAFMRSMQVDKSFKQFIDEAMEEHNLINIAIEDMRALEIVSDIWRAKLKVLKDLLERHFTVEEKEMFKLSRELFDEKKSAELAREFKAKRDLLMKVVN